MTVWLRKGICVRRKCDFCNKPYLASKARLRRGVDLCCQLSCARKKRGLLLKRKTKYRKTRPHTKFKDDLRERVGHRCQRCCKKQLHPALDVHRVIPDERGGEYVSINCLVLCKRCHGIMENLTYWQQAKEIKIF